MKVVIENNKFFKNNAKFHIVINVFSIPEAEDFLINNKFVDVDNDFFRFNSRCRCCGCFHVFEKYDFDDPEEIIKHIERTEIFVDSSLEKPLACLYDAKDPSFFVICETKEKLFDEIVKRS